MKKSVILLGAFALLFAAPSFAQEKSENKLKTLEAKPAQIEKVEETQKVESNKELEAKPEKKVVQKRRFETIKSVESRNVKSTEPLREEEK